MNKTKIEALRNELLQEAERLNRPTGQLGRIARKLTAILEEELTPEQAGSTPANRWAKEGEADPHGTSYDCERASLTLGQYTDDELANGVFLNADQPMNIERILARDPNYHAPIAWLTAAKDRIRWLSRALVRAEGASLPSINIRCETTCDGVMGTTTLNVVRVEREDDGSLTAVTDYWPNAHSQKAFLRELIPQLAALYPENVGWDSGWRSACTRVLNELEKRDTSATMTSAPSAGISLTPAQWADVYYFARASEIGEFLGRAEEVFNASLGEKRQ
jgi:hypothetical protein